MNTLIERHDVSTQMTLRNRVRIVIYRVCLTKMKIVGITNADKAQRNYARNLAETVESRLDKIIGLLASNVTDLSMLDDDTQIETILSNNWTYLSGSMDA